MSLVQLVVDRAGFEPLEEKFLGSGKIGRFELRLMPGSETGTGILVSKPIFPSAAPEEILKRSFFGVGDSDWVGGDS